MLKSYRNRIGKVSSDFYRSQAGATYLPGVCFYKHDLKGLKPEIYYSGLQTIMSSSAEKSQ
jgi:hypothetical protein